MQGTEGKGYRGHLRNRLILLYALPLLALLLALAFFYDYMARRSLEREMGLRLSALASELAEKIPPWQVQVSLASGAAGVRLELTRQLQRLAHRHDLARLYLADLQNRSLADSLEQTAHGQIYFKHEFDRPEIAFALEHGAASSRLFRGRDGRWYKSAYAAVLEGKQPLAVLGLEANAAFFQNLSWIRSRVLLFLLLSTALVIAIGILFSRRIVRPVQRLVEAARRIGHGDFATPVPQTGRGEIAFLARTLDQMRQSIVSRDQKSNMMLRGIAHELRNPLGAIELHSGLAFEDSGNRAAVQESLQNIRRDVAGLKKLIEEFLDFGREAVLQKVPLSTGRFLQESLQPLRAELSARGIAVECHLGKVPPLLWADPDQLRRALLNLYHNAAQALPDGGRFQVRLGEAPQGTIAIEVEDSGPGVAAEHLDKLFQPFFTTKKKGCGLGLAFAQKIVLAHGGNISYRPSSLGGACFRIELPA